MRPGAFRWLGTVLVVSLAALFAAAAGPIPAEAAGETDSAQTVASDSVFPGFKVTVDQTKGLTDQAVRVSWTGGQQTEASNRYNFVQIFQCWGAGSEPVRENCQVQGRAVTGVDAPAVNRPDPLEPVTTTIPFKPAPSRVQNLPQGSYFDDAKSNEIPTARISPGGTGEWYFAVQSALEANGFDCGERVAGSAAGKSCWLVVVPRNSIDVDGTDIATTGVFDRLVGGPLSASNWRNRLAFKLEFQTVTSACSLGTPETLVSTNELASAALLAWNAGTCAPGERTFVASRLTDDSIRRKLAGASPGLGLVGRADPNPPAGTVRAPVAISGLAVGFIYVSNGGGRLTDMKLTPRLLAKLLTQAYVGSVTLFPNGTSPDGTTVESYLRNADPAKGPNPTGMLTDPEFQALNPEFVAAVKADGRLQEPSLFSNIITPFLPADAIEKLWEWVRADADARDFLAGRPDPYGMLINPKYTQLGSDINDFPRLEDFCYQYTKGVYGLLVDFTPPPLCQGNMFPYADTFGAGARVVQRGEQLAIADPGSGDLPPVEFKWKRNSIRTQGGAGLVVTDMASAARYSLSVASLLTSSGTYVAPNEQSLSAAASSISADELVTGAQPALAGAASDAYPLTQVLYATTVPARLSAADRALFGGTLLPFAAGPGQRQGTESGNLPEGYAPLSEPMRAQALLAARQITDYAPAAASTPTPTSNSSTTAGGSTTARSSAAATTTRATSRGTAPTPVPAGGAPLVPAETVAPDTQSQSASPIDVLQAAQAGTTSPTPIGIIRFVFPGILILAAAAAVGGWLTARAAAQGKRSG